MKVDHTETKEYQIETWQRHFTNGKMRKSLL